MIFCLSKRRKMDSKTTASTCDRSAKLDEMYPKRLQNTLPRVNADEISKRLEAHGTCELNEIR